MTYTFPGTTISKPIETFKQKIEKNLVINSAQFDDLVNPKQTFKKSKPIDIPWKETIEELSWQSRQFEENEHEEYEFDYWIADSFR